MNEHVILLMGIDVGTTLIKAGIIDEFGHELAYSAVPTTWQRESTGGHIRPADLLAGVASAAASVLAKAPEGRITGVGVTGMAETVVLEDSAGETIEPAVAWFDVRAAAEFAELKVVFGDGVFGSVTGLGTRQIPSIANLHWLVRNCPETRRAVSAASVPEWVVARLGGDRASEASLATRTGALAVSTRAWWPDAFDWAGVPSTMFAPVRSAGDGFGRITAPPPGLERLRDAVLTVAGHDHLCAAVGIGAISERQVMDDCGTSEAFVRAIPADPSRDISEGLPLGLAIGWHVLPDRYALLCGWSLGLNLTPVLESLGVASRDGLTDLDDEALAAGDVASSPSEPAIRSAGRTWRTAVATAVEVSRQRLDKIEELTGPVGEVLASGGWSRNPVLRAMKAEVFPALAYPLVDQAGIRGAALFAGLASGVFPHASAFPQPKLDLASGAVPVASVGPSPSTP